MQNKLPLVSVIMPAYNTSNYIVEAIESVLQQTYVNLEVIIVNDGSTDDTLKIIESFNNNLIIITQPQSGAAQARNTGIKTATGEYIAFIDSDDYWFKEKIELQVAYLQQNPEIGAVYTAWKRWLPTNGKYPPALSLAPSCVNLDIDLDQSGWLYTKLLLDSIMHASNVMVRKGILDKAGYFDCNLKVGEDYNLWFRLSRIAKIDKLSTVLSLYRLNPESTTNIKPLTVNYRLMVIERAINKWGYSNPDGSTVPPNKVKRELSKVCFSFAYQHYHSGDLNIAINAIILSLKYNPLNYSAIKYTIIILIGYTIYNIKNKV